MGNGSEIRGGREETQSEREIRLAVEADKDAQVRVQNCMVDIRNALKKWNCIVDPMVQISSKGVQTNWAVVPLLKRLEM